MNTNKIISFIYYILDGYYDYVKNVWCKKILEYNQNLMKLSF